MSPEREALAVVWKHKGFWLIQSAGFAAWTVLALSWFWLPDSQVWGVALAAVQGLAVVLSGLWLIRTALVFYRGRLTCLPYARLCVDLVILAAIGVYVPYKLIGWHPRLSGLAMQTGSVVVRFGAAFLLAVSAWLILASLLAGRPKSSSERPAPQIAQPDR